MNKQFILFTLLFITLDMSWIKLNANGLYSNIFNGKINYLSGVFAYALLLLNYFLINREKTLRGKLEVAALSGFIIYGAFGFILATFYSKYPLHVAFIDSIWGAVLYSVVTYFTNLVTT